MSEKDLMDLRVEDVFEILTGKPAVIKEDTILKDVVESIIQSSTSRKVYVVDDSGILLGVITIETLLRQVGYKVGVRETGIISFFKFLTGVFKDNVSEFMDKPVKIYKSDKLLEAMQLMVEHHLNDLPIVDDEDRIIGELHSIEILKYTKDIFDKE
jgi:CBS domain-containing protein